MDKSARIAMILLLIPILNWIVAPLLAISVGLMLLARRQYIDFFIGCALSAVWGIASFWMLAFGMQGLGEASVLIAIVWFIAFYFFNRYLLNWFNQALLVHEPDTVQVDGSIRS